jgi:hypothetical protein
MTATSSAMHLIQLLLPLRDNNQQNFPAAYFDQVRHDLTQRFGGVTAFLRAPALGVWKEADDDVNRDEVVMFEVMCAELDRAWWAGYREELEQRFRQDEVLIWASEVTKL